MKTKALRNKVQVLTYVPGGQKEILWFLGLLKETISEFPTPIVFDVIVDGENEKTILESSSMVRNVVVAEDRDNAEKILSDLDSVYYYTNILDPSEEEAKEFAKEEHELKIEELKKYVEDISGYDLPQLVYDYAATAAKSWIDMLTFIDEHWSEKSIDVHMFSPHFQVNKSIKNSVKKSLNNDILASDGKPLGDYPYILIYADENIAPYEEWDSVGRNSGLEYIVVSTDGKVNNTDHKISLLETLALADTPYCEGVIGPYSAICLGWAKKTKFLIYTYNSQDDIRWFSVKYNNTVMWNLADKSMSDLATNIPQYVNFYLGQS